MQNRSEKTRTHLLEAASQLFSRLGYDATGVAEICQAAGVSKGAFYHHFPSKQAVFLELTSSWLEKLDVAFQAAAQRASDVPEALTQMAAAAAQQLRAADQQLPIILEFWRQANRDPAIWRAAVAPYHRYHAYFSDLVRRGVAEGALQPSDPDLVARALISLALGLLLQALFDPQGADWGQETESSINLLVSNLLRRQT